MSDVETRQLSDRAALADLVVTYSRCLDAYDHAGYAALFAPTGRLEAGLGNAEGPDAIRELLDAKRGDRAAAGQQAVHLVGNQLIDIDGDRASARTWWSYIAANGGKDDGVTLVKGGEYDDEFVRIDGQWRLALHRITRVIG